MANTPIEFRWHSGQTLTADLVAADDTQLASGLNATELTNGKGRYRVTYTGAATGHATLHIISGGQYLTPVVDYILVNTTDVHYPVALIDSAQLGEGAYTGTLTIDDGSTGLQGAVVNARRGGVLKASGTTDSSGEITNWVFGAYTYDLAVRLAGYQPKTDTIAVSADAWTKTISLTAISISAPSAATLCTVQFRVKISNTAVSGAVCKAKLNGVNHASDGTVLSNQESSDTTDAQGVAELELVQKGSLVKGNGLYDIWVEIDGKPVASAKTTIPDQSTILFEDLMK